MDFLIPITKAAEMRQNDFTTISNEPISSVELMERASRKMFEILRKDHPIGTTFLVLCGPGNNGGDGAVIGRLLIGAGYKCRVVFCDFGKQVSRDNQINRNMLLAFQEKACTFLNEVKDIDINEKDIILDCLFGTGLSGPLDGQFLELVNHINQQSNPIISIDIPSGVFTEKAQNGSVYIKSNYTITVQAPKPSFFYPENEIVFQIADAGIGNTESTGSYFLSPQEPWKSRILNSLPQKQEFGHKGSFGHVLIAGGNKGMHGAVALAAKSCIQNEAGLTTVLSPAGSRLYMSAEPRAMHLPMALNAASVEQLDLSKISVLAVGPGLNTTESSLHFLRSLLKKWDKPALLDADALNLLARNSELWDLVKPLSILTPHALEFERLFGHSENGEAKWNLGKRMAVEKGIYILAKGKYSMLFCPDDTVVVNGTGGPWLSIGGSGDTLTGAIAAWWSRTSDPREAAMAGMYSSGLK